MYFDVDRFDALVMYDASEHNADLYYTSGFLAPDAFVFVQLRDECVLMTSDLELDRARQESRVDRVVSSSQYAKQLRERGVPRPRTEDCLLALLRELHVERIVVPARFAVRMADSLRSAGLEVVAATDPLLPQRQVKSDTEVEAVQQAQRAAQRAMEVAIQSIRAADVESGVLVSQGQVLTSEHVRRLIHVALVEEDFRAAHTIVACGDQACDPHCMGSGPLRAGETIIIDIFPQSMQTGYFGDMTRTVVKGEPSILVRRLFDTVLRVQDSALGGVRAGVDGAELHRQVQQLFLDAGYETGEVDGHMQGFFHGTGHGVGLEVHEAPRLGVGGDVLKAGHVVTVEPGLYYPGVGGVRLEDTVVVRTGGCDNLTSFPRFLQV